MVVDIGAFLTKAGVTGDEDPWIVFPSCVGRLKPGEKNVGLKQFYVGDEALNGTGISLRRPIEVGK